MPSKAPRTPVFNPETGKLELGEGADRYGTAGELLGDTPGGGSMARSQGYDPRYYEQYQMDTGDGGTQTAWRLRQDVQERLGDRVQVSQPGVVGRNPDGSIMEGQGFNEVLDPSLVTWDDEFGWVMPKTNLSGSDPDDAARWERIRIAALVATALGAMTAGGAFAGFGAAPEVAVAAPAAEGAAATSAVAAEGAATAGVAEAGALGSGSSLAGTGLAGEAGALGSGTSLAGTGVAGTGATSIAGTGALGVVEGGAATSVAAGATPLISGSATPAWQSMLQSPFSQRLAAGLITGAASSYSAARRQEDAQRAAAEEAERNRAARAAEHTVNPGTWTAAARQIYPTGLPRTGLRSELPSGGLINTNRGG